MQGGDAKGRVTINRPTTTTSYNPTTAYSDPPDEAARPPRSGAHAGRTAEITSLLIGPPQATSYGIRAVSHKPTRLFVPSGRTRGTAPTQEEVGGGWNPRKHNSGSRGFHRLHATDCTPFQNPLPGPPRRGGSMPSAAKWSRAYVPRPALVLDPAFAGVTHANFPSSFQLGEPHGLARAGIQTGVLSDGAVTETKDDVRAVAAQRPYRDP